MESPDLTHLLPPLHPGNSRAQAGMVELASSREGVPHSEHTASAPVSEVLFVSDFHARRVLHSLRPSFPIYMLG